MLITPEVKTENAAVKAAALRVISNFGLCLPESRLLCFLDDEDAHDVSLDELGPANRGQYRSIHDSSDLNGLPSAVKDCICPLDFTGRPTWRRIDDLVYLKRSACVDEVGLTMTLAHELQHAIQHAKVRKLWATNTLASWFLMRGLDKNAVEALELTWASIPIELEARIVSKRVAECLFGEERVTQYIEKRIAERVTEADVADWKFIRKLLPSSSVDLVGSTKILFKQLRGHRPGLEELLRKMKEDGPDFSDIDLDSCFEDA
jgi:hypothetical protein